MSCFAVKIWCLSLNWSFSVTFSSLLPCLIMRANVRSIEYFCVWIFMNKKMNKIGYQFRFLDNFFSPVNWIVIQVKKWGWLAFMYIYIASYLFISKTRVWDRGIWLEYSIHCGVQSNCNFLLEIVLLKFKFTPHI